MDMAPNMALAARNSFTNSSSVIDRFHVVKLVCDAMQHIRTSLRWQEIDNENRAIKEAKEKDGKYYVRYDLSSEGNKSARVQLVKVENKWLVEGLFYSYEQLPTIPAADKDTADKDTVNNDQKAPTEECAVESLAAQGPDVKNDPRCPSPR